MKTTLGVTRGIKWEPHKVMLLEVDGLDGWMLPTSVQAMPRPFEIEFTWDVMAPRHMNIRSYRIWVADRWIPYDTHLSLNPFDTCQIRMKVTAE